MMNIDIPEAVEEIIGKLRSHGFEAFAVGGCVRDSVLGREPGDWDITTSASPWQVKEIFARTINTGIQHGTVTVMRGGTGYEVTTYRIDGEYEDGRHPKSVAFTQDLSEDLCRRDFTINAMAYSRETGIVDIFGGMEDLRRGIIRCVGNPIDRFTEDALRILRALRFSAQLGFSIEEETEKAIREIAPNLAKVSKERVQAELTKLLLSDHPETIQKVYALGISPYVSEAFHRVSRRKLCIHPALPKKKHIRWSAFLKEEPRQNVIQVLKDLKMDNDTIARTEVLTKWILRDIPEDKAEIRRVMSTMEPELFDDLLLLKASMEEASENFGKTSMEEASENSGKISMEEASENSAETSMKKISENPAETSMEMEVMNPVRKAGKIGRLMELAEEIRRDGDCIYLKDLALTGKDLLEHGMKPGKQIGTVLSELLEFVLVYPQKNQKEVLLERVFGGKTGK